MNGKKSLTRFRDRATAVLAAAGVIAMTAGFLVMAVASPAQAAERQVNICHRTDNDKNPYTYQRVSAGSTQLEGHLDHRTENGGGEDKYWHADGTWNGIDHDAGDFKPDYIEGLDDDVPTGDIEGRNYCLTQTDDILASGTLYLAAPPTCLADGVLQPQPQVGVTANQSPSGTGPATYTIRFVAASGYVLTGSATQTITVLPKLTGAVDCPGDPTPVVPAIDVSDPCGTANDSVTGVPNVGYEFVVTGNTVTFTAVGDNVFADETQTAVLTADFTDVPCPVGPKQVKPAIDANDPCGTANDSVDGVEKVGYRFDVDGDTVTFTAAEGFELVGDSVLAAEFTDEACPAGIAGTETATPKPDKTPQVRGTEAVPTAVAAGIGGSGPTMTGSSPIDLLAQMLVGGGLALLMAAGWLQIGRQTHGVHQA